MLLILDWLTREGHILLLWWLWIALAGIAVLPLCLNLLGGLPDKGYTLARPIGILLVTTVYWLLGSYGFLENSSGGIALSWFLVLIASIVIYRRSATGSRLAEYWRENRMHILAAELLFIALFFAWALYRAHQNDIVGTEKPMELAFLSATQRSASFPPPDPWMSGYAISYYYLGYVISSALALLGGVGSTLSFNLTIASQFALTGLAAFGVAYNLLRSRAVGRIAASAAGVLALLMLTVLGNFQFLLIEAPYQTRTGSAEYLDSWGTQMRSGLAAAGYQADPAASISLDSSAWDYWWWFRASRVLTDYDLDNKPTAIQPISEFPAFSFLLSDNHPHVLALPFVVMTIGLMLNVLLLRRPPSTLEVALYGVAIGGLVFLNAWDGPIYLCGFVGVEALRRLYSSERGWLSSQDWRGIVHFGALIALAAAIVYLPYFVGFRSQAGGILPNLINPTLFHRLFIAFGPFIVILAAYLALESWRARRSHRLNWRLGLQAGALALLLSAGLMAIIGVIIAIANPNQTAFANAGPVQDLGAFLLRVAERRINYALTSVLLLLGIAVVVARLFPSARQARKRGEIAVTWIDQPRANGFALLLIGMGLSLLFFTEFFYLKDNFGVRINTVFKLNYQAWVLWSIASAYAVYSVLFDRELPVPNIILRLPVGILIGLCLVGGFSYTFTAIYHRAWHETGRSSENDRQRYAPPENWDGAIRHVAQGARVAPGAVLYSRIILSDAAETDLIRADRRGIVAFDQDAVVIREPLTLDGAEGLLHADDQQVINCLAASIGKADAVAVEAVQRAYDIDYGRIGALAGIPIVLGWENHERQWRGATYQEIAGTRREDIDRLYTAVDFADVDAIIKRYGIDYILFGATERRQYGSLGEEKFLDALPALCEAGESRIYATG